MLKPIYIDVNSNSKESKPICVTAEVGKATEKIVTPDWNQNDPKASNYIKNRPFYTYFDAETHEYVDIPIESKYLKNAAPDYTLKNISTDLSNLNDLFLLVYNSSDNDYSRYLLSTIINFIEEILDNKIENNEIITNLQSSVADILDTIDGMQGTIKDVQDSISDMQDNISNIQDAIDNMQDSIDSMQNSISDLDRRVTALEQGQDSSMTVDSEGYLVTKGAYVDEEFWLVLNSSYYVDEENLLNCRGTSPSGPGMVVDSDGYLIPSNSFVDESGYLILDSSYYVDEEHLLTI